MFAGSTGVLAVYSVKNVKEIGTINKIYNINQ